MKSEMQQALNSRKGNNKSKPNQNAPAQQIEKDNRKQNQKHKQKQKAFKLFPVVSSHHNHTATLVHFLRFHLLWVQNLTRETWVQWESSPIKLPLHPFVHTRTHTKNEKEKRRRNKWQIEKKIQQSVGLKKRKRINGNSKKKAYAMYSERHQWAMCILACSLEEIKRKKGRKKTQRIASQGARRQDEEVTQRANS